MAINTADLHKAVSKVWDDANLDNRFTELWSSSVDSSQYAVLNDTEAAPTTPMPYCVMEASPGDTVARMTAADSQFKRDVREIPWEFRVHARSLSGDSRSAKEISADLAAKIIEIFGGHPELAPCSLMLDNGNFLQARYENDYGVRTGDEEYQWIVSYTFMVDVQVAV